MSLLQATFLPFCIIAAFIFGSEALSWTSSKNGLPQNAVLAGYDSARKPLFVGRAQHNGGNVIANVSPDYKIAYIPYNGKEVYKYEWEYLTSDCYKWKRFDGSIPEYAIYSVTKNANKAYVGRKNFSDRLIPGKISARDKKLHLPLNGNEYVFNNNFEILLACKN